MTDKCRDWDQLSTSGSHQRGALQGWISGGYELNEPPLTSILPLLVFLIVCRV
ncbi:MAG: hypothetical protein ABIJ65_07900 [Chloroflexota bacterium]